MADKFEELRTFVTVIDSGGVVVASQILGIAKSGVSRRLSDLETRIGAILVERTTRRFEPTVAGLAYYAEAQRILAAVDALDASFDAAGSRTSVTVTIRVEQGILGDLLIDGIATFRRRRPEVVVDVVHSQSSARADVIVRAASGHAPRRSDERTIARTRQVLCASPDFLQRTGTPAAPVELTDRDAIVVGDASDAQWRFGGGAKAIPNVVLSVPDEQMALRAAAAGAGMVQLPDYLVSPAIEAGRLRPILEEFLPDEIEVVAGCDSSSAIVAQLVDHLAATWADRRVV